MVKKLLATGAVLLALAGPAAGLLAVATLTGPALASAGSTCTPGTGGGPLRPDAPVPPEARAWVAAAAEACTDLPASWLAAVMAHESGFDPAAYADDVNGGTWGLFQLSESVWTSVYGGGFDTDRDGDSRADVIEPLVHARAAGTYLCALLAQVRAIRQAHPDWAATRQLTELEALVVAHNAGPGRLETYPDIPEITKAFVADVDAKAAAWTQSAPDRPVAETGAVVLPLPAGAFTLSSGFAWRVHPITGQARLHAGSDYAAAAGTPILAVADGVVGAAGPTAGFGNWIVVRHTVAGQTWTSVSGHMYPDGIFVRVGEQVRAGQQIGEVGAAGLATGYHLHLEIHTGDSTANTTALDPVGWLTDHGARPATTPAGVAPRCPTPTPAP